MVDTEIYSYDNKIKRINKVEFTIWGNNSVKESSVLGTDNQGINIPELYENQEPKRGGLIDPRLGPTGLDRNCETCGLNNTYCVGHFGHIDLAEPIFHYEYLTFVKKILGCICLKCSKLLIHKKEGYVSELLKSKSGRVRLNEIRALTEDVATCAIKYNGCGTPVAKIRTDMSKTGAITLVAETEIHDIAPEDGGDAKNIKKVREILTAGAVYDILRNISDIDCRVLGMDPDKSRPEMMIIKVFPVPPVQIRPSARADFGGSSTLEDDLTHVLASIVKDNIRIRRQKETMTEAASKFTAEHTNLLQFHGTVYLNNESMSLPRSELKGKPTKSLGSRLKGKEGRIRGNLMGKRVDFSARTVITSDPVIGINELGIPIKIAMNLTFPEIVTPENIDVLTKLVRNGSEIYPGANYVFPASRLMPGQRMLPILLRYKKDKIDLNYGDIVERHLQNGDIVLLNRQPTLHKQSMMGHRAKIINDPTLNTFRLNVAATTPYNADKHC